MLDIESPAPGGRNGAQGVSPRGMETLRDMETAQASLGAPRLKKLVPPSYMPIPSLVRNTCSHVWIGRYKAITPSQGNLGSQRWLRQSGTGHGVRPQESL